ncbi:MAG: chemotaxis protein CheW [Acidobacteriota bacterium]
MKQNQELPQGNQQIDWSKVHRRIAAAQQSLDANLSASAAQKKKILDERARALAMEAEPDALVEELEVLEFVLAYERYAVESAYIREVVPFQGLTPLPCTPPFVVGIVQARGQILSVINIKKFLGFPQTGIADLHKIIILHFENMEFGVLADDIIGARRLPTDQLQTSLPALIQMQEAYLKGITRDRVVVLDARKLLLSKNLLVNQKASQK